MAKLVGGAGFREDQHMGFDHVKAEMPQGLLSIEWVLNVV